MSHNKQEYQYHLKKKDENGDKIYEDNSDENLSSSDEDENKERGNWSRKMDFVLSCLSYAVGLGNVWRFPYVCYRNGGGAFLIPFVIMLFVTGIPLVYLEMSFGQFASSGVVSVWKAAPLFQGVGWAMFIVSVLIAIYYNMIIAYAIYYLFASLQSVLPWSECGLWSSEACVRENITEKSNCTQYNGTWCNNFCYHQTEMNTTAWASVVNCSKMDVISPSDDYFHSVVLDISEGIHDMGSLKWQLALCLLLAWVNICMTFSVVLDISEGIHDMGSLKWQLTLCLLLAWVLICICLAKGIKSGGKAAYFTAFFPYVVLSILLVRSLTLEGSTDGIIYYLKPQWSKLGSAKVWGDAAIQIFFSLSPCWGGLVTLASYNKFHNNCFIDAVIVSIMDSLTSVFAGLVIFSVIGFMAHELKQPVSEVATEGAGLAFIVYPEVVTKLPISQLWSVLFFLMLITLGLGTQISTVTTVHTTLMDRFPHVFLKNQTRRLMLLIGISLTCFLIGLAFATQGGMYILQLFDNYAASYSLLVIGLVESLALAWVYGADRFLGDIESMLGYRPHVIWAWSWRLIAPAALTFILIFTWVDFKPTTYQNEVFPGWADGMGWVISLSSIMAIPVVMVYQIYVQRKNSRSTIIESIKFLTKPTPDWGPNKKEHRAERAALDKLPPDSLESTVPLTGVGRTEEVNGGTETAEV